MRSKRKKTKAYEGATEIWTRIAGFKVQSANHYTMGPVVDQVQGIGNMLLSNMASSFSDVTVLLFFLIFAADFPKIYR